VWVRNQDDVTVVKELSKDSDCFTLWCMRKSMSKRVIELSDSDSICYYVRRRGDKVHSHVV